MQALGSKLDALMENIDSDSQDSFAGMKQLLEWDGSGKMLFPRTRTLSVHASSFFAVLRAYDMAISLERGGRGVDAQVHNKTSLPANKGLTTVRTCLALVAVKSFNRASQHWSKFKDWVAIMEKSKTYIEAIHYTSSDAESPSSGNTLMRLMDFLSSSQDAGQGYKIAQNFAQAALYLNIVMQSTKQDVILEMPDNLYSFMCLAHE